MSVLGTNLVVVTAVFSRGLGITERENESPLITLSGTSHHDGSPFRYTLKQVDKLVSAIPILHYGQRQLKFRNINLIPFRQLRLRVALGSTNPWLTNIAKEPLPLRRHGFSPCYAATHSMILVGTRSIGPHGPTSAHAPRPAIRLHFCTP